MTYRLYSQPDWDAVRSALSVVKPAMPVPPFDAWAARRFLVAKIAADTRGPFVTAYVRAIYALGFAGYAVRLEARLRELAMGKAS